MIVVTAVQNGSGRMRSVSSGATIVSPGLDIHAAAAEPRVAGARHDAAVGAHDVDAIVVGARRQAAAHRDVVVARQVGAIQVRGCALHFADDRDFLRDARHQQAIAVLQHDVLLRARLRLHRPVQVDDQASDRLGIAQVREQRLADRERLSSHPCRFPARSSARTARRRIPCASRASPAASSRAPSAPRA